MLSKLLALLLLLAGANAYAVPMSQCADGAHWYPTAEGPTYCPPVVAATTTTPGTTTITIVGTTTTANGTVTASVRLNCTALQWRRVTDGVGDEATASDSDVTSGAFSISITGVAEGTSYCVHLVQYTASGKPSNAERVSVTTLESAPSAPEIGAEITGGDDWFFCPDGSDANSGLTNTLRKQNFPTTDTSMLSTSHDMWLCAGGTWKNREMYIARAGTSGNIAETGTYYQDGATTRKAVDGIFGEGTEHTKAELHGGLTTACMTARTCRYPTAFPVDTYSSAYDAILQVVATADYNTISNIAIRYTVYHPFTAYGSGSTGSLHHVIFDGIDLIDVNGNMIINAGVQDVVVRNGTARNYSTCKMQRWYETTLAAECSWYGWSGGVPQMIGSTNMRGLVEYQHVTHGWGEGMNAFGGATHVVFRNNFCANVLSVCIYVDAATDIVIESNILQGEDSTLGYVLSGSPGFTAGVWIDHEEFAASSPGPTGMVVRNNLCVSLESNCVLISLWDGIEALGTKNVGAKVYGNTSIGSASYDLDGGSNLSSSARIAEWDSRNNAVWNDTLTTAACYARTGTNQYNRWSHAQGDADCNGTGVTNGALTLTQNTYATWIAKTATSAATFADANPAGGSALIGAGVALTSAILDKDNYGYGFSQIREVLDTTLTEAEWECALCVDALGATRASPPSIGAVE